MKEIYEMKGAGRSISSAVTPPSKSSPSTRSTSSLPSATRTSGRATSTSPPSTITPAATGLQTSSPVLQPAAAELHQSHYFHAKCPSRSAPALARHAPQLFCQTLQGHGLLEGTFNLSENHSMPVPIGGTYFHTDCQESLPVQLTFQPINNISYRPYFHLNFDDELLKLLRARIR